MIHGHKVLEYIISKGSINSEELKSDILGQYGEDVRFEACSADGMTFDDLMKFLIEKQKIAIVDGQVSMVGQMCDH